MRESIAESGYFAVQTWYFGYVLAFVITLLTIMFVRLRGCKQHLILWFPVTVMILLCLAVKFADVKLLDYFEKCRIGGVFWDDGHQLGSQGAEAYIRYYNLKLFETRSISRWVRNSWYYMGTTAVFSGAGFVLHKASMKPSRRFFLGRTAAILILLLTLCSFDRHFAVSAEFLFLPQKFNENIMKYMFVMDTSKYGLTWQKRIGSPDDYVLENTITLHRDITMYAEPSTASGKLYIINEDKNLKTYLKKGWDVLKFMSLGIPSVAGWRCTVEYDNTKKDENGLSSPAIEGYIRINDILNACGGDRFIIRMELMQLDVLLYTKGIMVSPSIMYAFEPLEIYLLLPLSLLSLSGWVLWVISDKRHIRRIDKIKKMES